jgi:hypothetical protein
MATVIEPSLEEQFELVDDMSTEAILCGDCKLVVTFILQRPASVTEKVYVPEESPLNANCCK